MSEKLSIPDRNNERFQPRPIVDELLDAEQTVTKRNASTSKAASSTETTSSKQPDVTALQNENQQQAHAVETLTNTFNGNIKKNKVRIWMSKFLYYFPYFAYTFGLIAIGVLSSQKVMPYDVYQLSDVVSFATNSTKNNETIAKIKNAIFYYCEVPNDKQLMATNMAQALAILMIAENLGGFLTVWNAQLQMINAAFMSYIVRPSIIMIATYTAISALGYFFVIAPNLLWSTIWPLCNLLKSPASRLILSTENTE